MISICDLQRFCPRNLSLREMHVHLVSVEISVVCIAVGIVHSNCFLAWQDSCSVAHYGGLVKSWLTIHQNYITVGQMSMHLLVASTAGAVAR